MNRVITPAPVRKSVLVRAPVERAFEVFTSGIGRWWPKTHHIGASEMQAPVIEPRPGGRWFERGVDGVECEIGRVLVWEPPSRLVLAWQLNAEWKYDPQLITEVEVQFTPTEPRATRVELTHRHIERLGESAVRFREAIDSPGGWGGLLDLYAKTAAAG